MEQDFREEIERLRGRVAALEALLAAPQSRSAQTDLQNLLQSSPLPIITFDLRGLITTWNRAAEMLFGWTAEEVMAKPLPFIPAEKQQEHAAMRERDLSGSFFTGREIVRKCKNGNLIELSVSTAPLRNALGETEGILSLYADITSQKRSQRALKESEERQRLALEAGHVAIYDWDMKTGSLIWSDGVYDVLRLPQGCFGNTHADFLSIVHPEDRLRLQNAVQEAVCSSGHFELEYRVAPSGIVRWLHTVGRIVLDTSGEAVRMLGAALDTTERREFEEALRRSNRDLEEFAYVASHDLQEPLRMVAIYSQMLLRRSMVNSEERMAFCQEQIRAGVDRMQVLIRDLLAYSRIIHDEESDNSETCALDKALDRALENLHLRIQETGAVVRREPLPCTVGDEVQLAQLFQNLLANAIKYAKPGTPPVITIQSREAGDECIISVSDNGIGFHPQYAERIFGLFKRLQSSVNPGTGIGLAVCKRILERYHGRIWAESAEGAGSTFYFVLRKTR